MAQIDFFLSREEKLSFADLVFRSGAKMIVEDNYDNQSYITISRVVDYEQYVMSNALLFIVHPESLKHPFEWGSFEKDRVRKFFIRQKYGGPTIDFFSPEIIEQRDRKIGPGFLSSHSFYYSGKEKFLPNDHYKELFKTFSTYIKKLSKRIKLEKRSYWVGNTTIQLCYENKYSLVEIGGKNLMELI